MKNFLYIMINLALANTFSLTVLAGYDLIEDNKNIIPELAEVTAVESLALEVVNETTSTIPQTSDMNISIIMFVALALVSVVIGMSVVKSKKSK